MMSENRTAFILLATGLIGFGCGCIVSEIYQRLRIFFCKVKCEALRCKGTQNPRFFITGDKHRNFKSLIRFCKKNKTTVRDTIIVLGDAGFNYYGDLRDTMLKKKLSKANITLLCVHGNKENRPQNIKTYRTKKYCGGTVFYEEKYPNLLFAKDCEVYQLGGKSAIVIGGAHSIDKFYRIQNNSLWWSDEEPNTRTKKFFEKVLHSRNNEVDYIFTHTVPLTYEPTEMLLSNRNVELKFEPDIDKKTERWLDSIEKTVSYQNWFCGHYHIDKSVDRIELMHETIKELPIEQTLSDSKEE